MATVRLMKCGHASNSILSCSGFQLFDIPDLNSSLVLGSTDWTLSIINGLGRGSGGEDGHWCLIAFETVFSHVLSTQASSLACRSELQTFVDTVGVQMAWAGSSSDTHSYMHVFLSSSMVIHDQ